LPAFNGLCRDPVDSLSYITPIVKINGSRMLKLVSTILLVMLISACSTQTKQSQAVFDKELSSFNYPFDVKVFNLQSQNQTLKMRFMDIGDKKGKVALLLHGKNFSGYYWQRIAQDLANRGYRVVIPDQIGFGKSSKPSYYQYSFSQLSLNTQLLLENLGIDTYTLVGHSMGGMLAVNMAYLYEKSVDKLVLINPIGLEPYLDYVKYKDTNFFYGREMNKTIEKIRAYQQKNYYAGKWAPEYENLLEPFKGWLNSNDWGIVAWNNALTYGPIFSEDITPLLSKITTPTHLIIGTRDRTGPGRGWMKDGADHKLGQYQILGMKAQEKIKNSKLYELPGLGHMPQFEDYAKFSSAFFSILN